MTKMENQETNKSIAFTESKSLRNDAIEKLENYDFLDKLKVMVKNGNLTIDEFKEITGKDYK